MAHRIQNAYHMKRSPKSTEYKDYVADLNFGEVNYYVSQMLSCHGYFKKYLHRMSKASSPYCLYKEGEVIDDENTLFSSVLSLRTDIGNKNDYVR